MSIPSDLLNNFWDKTRKRQDAILQQAYDCYELLEAEKEELKDCLQSLADIQNGSPLIRDEKRWGKIMETAYKLLEV